MSLPTSDLASPHNPYDLSDWEPDVGDLKSYPHFDRFLPIEEIKELVRSPQRVAAHRFYPLLHFHQKWRRAPRKLGKLAQRKTGREFVKRDIKKRAIRYPSRRDSYIYKHYRQLMSPMYERRLVELGIEGCVLAYRRIPTARGATSNKSNIHFAKEAFDAIDELGKCVAIAIDISKFFESLDHARLKVAWQSLCGFDRLPDDHYAVFNSVTNYRWVDLNEAYVALGYSRKEVVKRRGGKSVQVLRYNKPPNEIRKQICTPAEYRAKIVDAGLVKKNDNPWGIPQGTPISDFLANLYMLDFDQEMHAYASARGGRYFRYSDDILLVLPGDGRAARAAENKVMKHIKQAGSRLSVNASKTEIVCFTPDGPQRCYSRKQIDEGSNLRWRMSSNEGLSYLGFRYDGRRVFLRNGTVTNLRGKIARTCKAVASTHVKRFRGRSLDMLQMSAPIEQVKQQYLKVKDFEEAVAAAQFSAFEVMTFWSYALRARAVFGKRGSHIGRQLRQIDRLIREELRKGIDNAYAIDRKRLVLRS